MPFKRVWRRRGINAQEFYLNRETLTLYFKKNEEILIIIFFIIKNILKKIRKKLILRKIDKTPYVTFKLSMHCIIMSMGQDDYWQRCCRLCVPNEDMFSKFLRNSCFGTTTILLVHLFFHPASSVGKSLYHNSRRDVWKKYLFYRKIPFEHAQRCYLILVSRSVLWYNGFPTLLLLLYRAGQWGRNSFLICQNKP